MHIDPLAELELDGKLGKGLSDCIVVQLKQLRGALSLDTAQCVVQAGLRKKIV